MRTYDSVFVSPHLDDAVLSCGGRIWSEALAGRRVLIATLFTRGGEDPGSQRLYAARREEDRRAASWLGADVLHFNLPDAPFRNRFYKDFRSIVLAEHADDREFQPTVSEAFRVAAHGVKRVYAPLAVGTHIDHRLTHRAAKSLPRPVLWYEDRPYAFLHHSVRMRFAESGLLPKPVPADLLPLSDDELRRTFECGLSETAFLQAYLPEGPERNACVEELSRRLLAPATMAELEMRPELAEFDAAVAERVVEAIADYASQMPDLFGSQDVLRREMRAYSARLGSGSPLAERCWRASALAGC